MPNDIDIECLSYDRRAGYDGLIPKTGVVLLGLCGKVFNGEGYRDIDLRVSSSHSGWHQTGMQRETLLSESAAWPASVIWQKL